MFKGIRKKLFISHLGVAMVSLLAVTLLVNLAMSYSFAKYLENQRMAEADYIVKELGSSYTPDNQWSTTSLMGISHRAMLQNMVIHIYDEKQRLIWDSSDTAMMGSPLDHELELSLDSAHKKFEMNVPIVKAGREVGRLELITNSNPFHEQEQQFLALFNTLLWMTIALVLIGIYFFSQFIANGISRPLIRIKDAAIRMKDRNLSQRVTVFNNSDEIAEVGIALNHLAEALQTQERLRKHLTADIAHELRTPLATIRSHIEAFQDGIWEPEPDKLQICHEQVMQLVHLINDLGELTAVENPMMRMNKQPLLLSQVIEESVKSVQGLWSQKDISMKINIAPWMIIHGDDRRLMQVFVNLIDNAYKYTLECGQITIEAKQERSGVVIEISDTGIGINQDELPYIFERFYRGEKSRNRRAGGSGIGLAIVKAIIEAHGGTVSANSQLHLGSQFSIYLPA